MSLQALAPGDIIYYNGGTQLVLRRNPKTYTLIPIINRARKGYTLARTPPSHPLIAKVDREHQFYETDKRLLSLPLDPPSQKPIAGTSFLNSPSQVLLQRRCGLCGRHFELGDRRLNGACQHYDCDHPQD